MDDLGLIIEQVEVMVNSIQKGVENVLRKQCKLKTLLLLQRWRICSVFF